MKLKLFYFKKIIFYINISKRFKNIKKIKIKFTQPRLKRNTKRRLESV
jgi:hypothetical protein